MIKGLFPFRLSEYWFGFEWGLSMHVFYTGQTLSDNNFIGEALVTGDTFEPDLTLVGPTQFLTSNAQTGWTTTFTGTGFSFNTSDEPQSGTLTSFTVSNGTDTIAIVSDISWSLVGFFSSMQLAVEKGDFTQLADLLNQSQSITVDGSMSSGGMRPYEMFSDAFYQINAPLTVTGSPDRDTVDSGLGDDYINLGSNEDTGDVFYGTSGNDTVDFADAEEMSWYYLSYGRFQNVLVNLGITPDRGSVIGDGFTDTLLHTDSADWGIIIDGTSGDDSFSIRNSADQEQWRAVVGGRGNDTFILNPAIGTIRLDFNYGGWEDANQGAVVNIGERVVANDGFGTSDIISLEYGSGRISMLGTNFGDSLTGGEGSDEFITLQGNDTIDGGAGFDRLRYDRFGVEAMNVDMNAGVATGIWNGLTFTDTFTNIEHVRGSREGNDTLLGDGFAEYLDGRGGDDRVLGGNGDDTLYGQDGDDTLNGGENNDEVYGGAGNDHLVGSAGLDLLEGNAGNDTLLGGANTDSLYGGDDNDILYGAEDDDFSSDRRIGDADNDTLYGSAGDDTLIGNEGNDQFFGGAGDDRLFGGAGNNRYLAGAGNDTIIGGEGAEVIDGGTGDDVMWGSSGGDLFIFADGHGNDTIQDFSAGDFTELLDLARVTAITSLADLDLDSATNGAATQVGQNVLIDTGSGTSITLTGVMLHDLNANDFFGVY